MIAAMQVEIWDARSFTPAQAMAIGELIHQVWPKPTMTAAVRATQQLALGSQYVGPRASAPRAAVVVEADRVVAHAALLPRTIGTENGDIVIGGLARVCSDPKLRGRGLGELVVRAAFGLIDAGNFEFSLFQTSRRIQPFYERFGAVTTTNAIINSTADDPAVNPFWDEVVMRYPGEGNWPTGTIDLRGPGY